MNILENKERLNNMEILKNYLKETFNNMVKEVELSDLKKRIKENLLEYLKWEGIDKIINILEESIHIRINSIDQDDYDNKYGDSDWDDEDNKKDASDQEEDIPELTQLIKEIEETYEITLSYDEKQEIYGLDLWGAGTEIKRDGFIISTWTDDVCSLGARIKYTKELFMIQRPVNYMDYINEPSLPKAEEDFVNFQQNTDLYFLTKNEAHNYIKENASEGWDRVISYFITVSQFNDLEKQNKIYKGE